MKVFSEGTLCKVTKPETGMSDPKPAANVAVCDGDGRPNFFGEISTGLGLEQGMVELVEPSFLNFLSVSRHTKGNDRWVISPTSAVNNELDSWRNRIITM